MKRLIALAAVLVALAAAGAASWNEHASAYSPDGWSWGDDPQ